MMTKEEATGKVQRMVERVIKINKRLDSNLSPVEIEKISRVMMMFRELTEEIESQPVDKTILEPFKKEMNVLNEKLLCLVTRKNDF